MFFTRKSLNSAFTHRNRASVSAVGKNLAQQIRFFAPLGPPPMFKRIIVDENDLKKFYPPSNSDTKITQQDRAEFLLTNKINGNEKISDPLNAINSMKISAEINENKEMKSDVKIVDDELAQSENIQNEEEKQKQDRKEKEERTKKGLKIFMVIGLAAFVPGALYTVYLCITYGPKYVWDYWASAAKEITEPSRQKLLPDPMKPPWHQPKYTVVLEIRNVLVNPEWNYKNGHHFVKRPALDYFLDVVGYPNFELVIYTSENALTAAPILAHMDPKGNRINHALFGDCTRTKLGWTGAPTYVKELSLLNRDLSKVIYIDWDPAAFQNNPENVLRVPKWEGDMNDTFLVDLAELLKTIHLSDVEDVRQVLQFYSQFDNPMAEFRRRAQMLNQDSTQRKPQSSSNTDAPSSSSAQQNQQMKKYQGNLFGARRHAI